MSRDNGPTTTARDRSMMLNSYRVGKVPNLGFEMAATFAREDDADAEPSDLVWQSLDVEPMDSDEINARIRERCFEDAEFARAFAAAEEAAAYDPRSDPDLPGWGTGIQWSDLHFCSITYEFADD